MSGRLICLGVSEQDSAKLFRPTNQRKRAGLQNSVYKHPAAYSQFFLSSLLQPGVGLRIYSGYIHKSTGNSQLTRNYTILYEILVPIR